jgi:hypothetical protein
VNGLCDQCHKAPTTTTTWFRLTGTRMFVSTERCDQHPYTPPLRPKQPDDRLFA